MGGFYYNKVMAYIIIFILIYLFMIYPGKSRKERLIPYSKVFIAHRGFFNNQDIPENSIKAFAKAAKNNFGIELDLQLTSDDKLVVFHDSSLKRMTGIDKKLTDCSFEELQGYNLLDTTEKIPLFTDVLKVINKDTPLIVEIKPDGRYIETVKKAVEVLRDYDGLYNIESFNPLVVYYLRKNEPDIIRGQLSYDWLSDKESPLNIIIKFILTSMIYLFINRPDYIAFDCNSYHNLSFLINSKLYKHYCVAWTVKSQKQFAEIKPYYNCFIFDSYIPENKDLLN